MVSAAQPPSCHQCQRCRECVVSMHWTACPFGVAMVPFGSKRRMVPAGMNGPVVAFLYKNPNMMPSNMTATNGMLASVSAQGSSPVFLSFMLTVVSCVPPWSFCNHCPLAEYNDQGSQYGATVLGSPLVHAECMCHLLAAASLPHTFQPASTMKMQRLALERITEQALKHNADCRAC